MRLVLAVEEGDRTAQRCGGAGGDGLARCKEERGVGGEEAKRVDGDGNPREGLGILMPSGATHDGNVGLEELGVFKRVAREGLEGNIGHERVSEEGQLQQVGRHHHEKRRGCAHLGCAQHTEQTDQDDEERDDGRHRHVHGEQGRVAAHVEALEDDAHTTDAKAHTNREGVEQVLDLHGQLDLVHHTNLGGDHVEREQDLELDMRCELVTRVGELRLALR